MSLRPDNLKNLELKTGASAGAVLEKLRNIREKNGMMNRIGDTHLYISGMYALRLNVQLEENNITHIVSVLRGRVDKTLIQSYVDDGRHLHIEVDDNDDENLIDYFKTSNEFIDKALESGGNVLVHCAMGISRSATICIAWLIYKRQISADIALEIVRQSRPIVCPNLAFRKQLELYSENLEQAILNLDDVPAYQRYKYHQEVELSRLARKAPTINHYGEDTAQMSGEMQLKCKKCRRTLALAKSFVEHPEGGPPVTSSSRLFSSIVPDKNACQHHFVDPVVWMKPELDKGELEGKLECPKCSAKVGSYAWQGLQCNCGVWVTPAISLAKSKVDEAKTRAAL